MFAYLTDNDSATNTFTVGNVDIRLEETNYNKLNSEDKILVCNQTVAKDPIIYNDGDQDALVFMTVTVPRANVTLVDDDGTKASTADYTDLFILKTSKDKVSNNTTNSINESEMGWKLISSETSSDKSATTYLYAYCYPVESSKSTGPNGLFDYVQLKNFVEDPTNITTENIIVNAYGIQASNIYSDGADITGTISQDTMAEIWDIYMEQNDV